MSQEWRCHAIFNSKTYPGPTTIESGSDESSMAPSGVSHKEHKATDYAGVGISLA